ncbi:MAG: phosphodiester glycosidase family protein [Clostridiales bacterium]|nr:phosphodiester glycosidase family protein [Eubacteriales bacterium]MDH7565586.1 phosphodiester glycosidase family protein [Clostridiales bacterium]
MGSREKNRTQKKKKTWKKFLIFLVFEIVFTAVTMPLLIFYGPFENVKKTLVGTAWNTLRHQYIAKIFLSDEAIHRILGSSFSADPVASGEEVQKLEFGVNHSDRIEIYNIDGGNFKGKLMIIFDPTKVKVGYSSQMPESGEKTSSIAKRNGAIAAINAGGFMDKGWTGTGGAPMGFIIHDGKIIANQIKDENVKQDTAAFTDKGMLIVGRHSMAQLKKLGVKEGVSFGPPLVVNGKPTITQGDGGWGINPRTAIGQREDGAVLFLTIDGRSLNSLGATLRDCQDILLQYKAVNAVNLDGGSSTTMYYNNKVINRPSDALGERFVPSVFMVVPGKEGEQ